MKDLRDRTLLGGFAKVCALVVNILLRIGSLMVLARLLDPEDFGLVAMVTVVTGVFEKFRDAGLSVVTVQRVTITYEQVSTLFWINMLVGGILGLLTLATAPLLVSFYHDPRLFWVTVVLAVGFIVNAGGVQHSALLQREMRFVALAVIETLSLSVSSAVGIGMAFAGYEYWALVGIGISMPVISTVCFWLCTAWVPGMPHRGVGLGSMIRFGGTTTLNTLAVYIAYNLEKVLLGRFWGAEALGIYGRAYQLINIPTDGLNSATGGIATSALSRLQGDPNRLKNYFLKGYSLVLGVTLPSTIACALFADDLVLVVLGPQWTDAAKLFRLLSPAVLVFALINPTGWLLYSLGLVGRSLGISLVMAPLVIAAYLLGLAYGPSGVAIAYSAAMTAWLIPHLMWCTHNAMMSARDLLRTARQPFLSAIVAATVAIPVQFFLGESLSPFLRLICESTILVFVYMWMLFYVMKQKAFYLDILWGLKRGSV